MHGYELIGELEERTGGRWRPSPGSVYPTLAQLEDEGLVRSFEDEGRKRFELTDAGRPGSPSTEDDETTPPWERSGVGGRGDLRRLGGEIFGQMRQLGRFGTPAQQERAREILSRTRTELYAVLADADSRSRPTVPRPDAATLRGVELVSDRRYRFPVPPVALWSALDATEDYRSWWPWLRSFEADHLPTGERWRCTVRPPLPYTLRFTIHLDEVERPRLVSARITGDIAGAARLDVEPHTDGCEVRLTSTLAPSNRAFGLIAAVARPIVRRGHDWVLDTGAGQFVTRRAPSRRLTRKRQKPPTEVGGFNVCRIPIRRGGRSAPLHPCVRGRRRTRRPDLRRGS